MSAVLIVDSSSEGEEPYVGCLRASGFEVLVVPTPEEACAAADRVCPEVVLAHVHGDQPDAAGLEITRFLRGQREIDDIPVVLMTRSLDPTHAAAVVDAGCDRYLRAPVSPDQLVREIRQVSDHARRLRDRSAAVLARVARLQHESDTLRARSQALRERPAVVTTDKFGIVVRMDDAASRLLNVSVRGGVGRNLLVFVAGERDRISRALARTGAGYSTEHQLTLRPRERKALSAAVELRLSDDDSGEIDWTIRRA
ncbi:MAG: two-component system, OmpR family, phosphate regulon response regulator PhoB [Acidobacteriota bacterium]|jgi:DNA-binding response OmpR family regulator